MHPVSPQPCPTPSQPNHPATVPRKVSPVKAMVMESWENRPWAGNWCQSVYI